MTDSLPLYNSRITKTYLEFIKKQYPDLDIDYLLEYARMTKYEVEDPAHWFSQDQADRFQEALVEKTGNLDIAR
ncbi:MAG: phosphohydrolase, partial [Deltaproteobacteria bacterium]|nr:phosphohydrolase [Deltaproteobacteria bacterium]